MTSLYIGIMSGTSADGIDAVVISGSPELSLRATHSQPIDASLRHKIHALCAAGDDEIERLGRLDRELGLAFADCINALLKKANLAPEAITAIGSHGQTIRHRPPQADNSELWPFTLQIADPNTLAEATGITVVADFRRRDLAAGGQGAPLVPAFHQAIFRHTTRSRALVNIGGMANITWLAPDQDTLGFDTGPGNVLLNAWIERHQGLAFDRDGLWASSGTLNQALLDALFTHPFLQQPPPKSTGREAFHLEWLDGILQGFTGISATDVQATLLAFTAQTIANDINRLAQDNPAMAGLDLVVCGGGARNPALMNALQLALPHADVMSTAALGIAPEWIEAIAFAWLAEQTINHRPGNLAAVTGAAGERILGGIYLA